MRPYLVSHLNNLFSTDIFGYITPGYPHMLGLAILLGSWLSVRSMKREQGLPELQCVIAILLAYVGAMVGSWLLGFLSMSVPNWLKDPSDLSRLWRRGGLVAYGGFIGGFTFPMLYLHFRAKNIDPWKMLDAGTPFVALGLAITRVGCFLAGCDFGKVSALPWAVQFPYKSPAYNLHLKNEWISDAARHSLPVQPTQLYAVLYGLIIFAVFRFVVFPRRRHHGQVFLGVCLSYACCRFLIEFVRGDVSRGLFFFLSTSQWISLALVALVTFMYFRILRPRWEQEGPIQLPTISEPEQGAQSAQ